MAFAPAASAAFSRAADQHTQPRRRHQRKGWGQGCKYQPKLDQTKQGSGQGLGLGR